MYRKRLSGEVLAVLPGQHLLLLWLWFSPLNSAVMMLGDFSAPPAAQLEGSHAIEKPGIFLGSSLCELFLLLGTFSESDWLLLSAPLLHSLFSSFSSCSTASPPCSWGLFSGDCSEIRTGITISSLLWSPSQALTASHCKARLAPARRQGRQLLRAAACQWQQIIPTPILG